MMVTVHESNDRLIEFKTLVDKTKSKDKITPREAAKLYSGMSYFMRDDGTEHPPELIKEILQMIREASEIMIEKYINPLERLRSNSTCIEKKVQHPYLGSIGMATT